MIVAEKTMDFKSLEREIFTKCCEIGREMLKNTIEAYDAQLRTERDRKAYRHKGTRKTILKTVMGEVEYRRAVYETRDKNGAKSHVYLLDEAMNIAGSGYFSGLLSEQIVRLCCDAPYRNAARTVRELTGQTISHTAVWNVAQAFGVRVDIQEQAAAKAASEHKGAGNLEAELLFEEQDGIWLKLQGKSREKHGASHEMKLAIAYDGAKMAGKNRYELTNKVVCANFESAGKFQRRKEGVIAGTYNVDEIKTRLLNGDGAAWIKQAVTDETVHFQLDPFHRNKAVRTWVKNPDMQKQIKKLLYDNDIDTLLTYIDACSNSVEDEDEQKNLLSLLTYFTNNKNGLVPCHRRGLALPKPPEDKIYRHMGAMESNIFTILGNRMKGRRACWSISGGNNLARLLCLKETGKLGDTLSLLTASVLPKRYADEIQIKMSAKNVPLSEGKGYNGLKQMLVPSSMKWMKNLASIKPLCKI